MTYHHGCIPNVRNAQVSIQHLIPTYDIRINKIQKLLQNRVKSSVWIGKLHVYRGFEEYDGTHHFANYIIILCILAK